jgi:hypothetical protein
MGTDIIVIDEDRDEDDFSHYEMYRINRAFEEEILGKILSHVRGIEAAYRYVYKNSCDVGYCSKKDHSKCPVRKDAENMFGDEASLMVVENEDVLDYLLENPYGPYSNAWCHKIYDFLIQFTDIFDENDYPFLGLMRCLQSAIENNAMIEFS